MDVKDIFNEDTSHEEAKEAIKHRVRSIVDEMAVSENRDSEDDNEEGGMSESDSITEAMKVVAYKASGGSDEVEINRKSELKKLAQSGKYDYFTVSDGGTSGSGETDYSVDPSGNLVEM